MNNKELLEKVQAFLEDKEETSSDYRNLLLSPEQRAIIAAQEAKKKKDKEEKEENKTLVAHYDPLLEQSMLPEPGTGGIGSFITQRRDRPRRKKSQGMSDYDATQAALTGAGLAPGIGNLADLGAVGHSLYHGKWGDAALNALAAIPGIGIGAGAAKLAKSTIKAADSAAGGAKALPPVRTDLPAPKPSSKPKPYEIAGEPSTTPDPRGLSSSNPAVRRSAEKMKADDIEFQTRQADIESRRKATDLPKETVPRVAQDAREKALRKAEDDAKAAAEAQAKAKADAEKAAKRAAMVKTGAKVITYPVRHPIKTAKGAVVGGAGAGLGVGGLVGLDAMVGDDYPIIRKFAKWLIGEEQKIELKKSLHEHVRQTIKNNNLYS